MPLRPASCLLGTDKLAGQEPRLALKGWQLLHEQ